MFLSPAYMSWICWLWCGLIKSSPRPAMNSAGINVRSAWAMGHRSRTLKPAVLITVPRIMRITIFATMPGTVKPWIFRKFTRRRKRERRGGGGYKSRPHTITPLYPCCGYAADFNPHLYPSSAKLNQGEAWAMTIITRAYHSTYKWNTSGKIQFQVYLDRFRPETGTVSTSYMPTIALHHLTPPPSQKHRRGPQRTAKGLYC